MASPSRPRPWSAIILAGIAVIAVVSNLGGAWSTWTYFQEWLQKGAAPEGWVLNRLVPFVVAVFALALLYAIYARLTKSDGPPERDDRKQWLIAQSAQKVRQNYLEYLRKDIEERLKSSIHSARFIDIGLDERVNAVLPWHYVSAYGQQVKRFHTFEDALKEYNGRLLLLGSPGSGKSTTLLHIARDFVIKAQEDRSAPIPLLLNLSKFKGAPEPRIFPRVSLPGRKGRPSDEETESLFENWLIKMLAELPVGGLNNNKAVARQWVKLDKVMLLLDGLDEVNDANLVNLVTLMNETYLGRHPQGVVVCSRIIDYQPLESRKETKLRLNGAVTLQPLDEQQINSYLEAARAMKLRDALPGDKVLYEMAKTPLTLSMMTLAYGGEAPVNLPPGAPFLERRSQFLDGYVERMVQRHARRKVGLPPDENPDNDEETDYPLAQINHYLGWLAIKISERTQTTLPLNRLYSYLAQGRMTEDAPLLRESRLACLALLTGLALCMGALIVSGAGGQRWWVVILGGLLAMVGATAGFIEQDDIDAEHNKYPHPRRNASLMVAHNLFVLAYLCLLLGLANMSLFSVLPLPSRPGYTGIVLVSIFVLLAHKAPPEEGSQPEGIADRAYKVTIWLVPCVVVAALVTYFGTGGLDYLMLGVAIGSGLAVFLLLRRIAYSEAGLLSYTAALLTCAGAVVAALYFLDLIVGAPGPVNLIIFASATLGLIVNERDISPAFIFLFATITFYLLGGAAWAVLLPLPAIILYLRFKAEAFTGVASAIHAAAERIFLIPTLKAVLRLRYRICFRFRGFLDYAVEAMLLKRAGVEYEFMHRLLRDHFAIRELVPALRPGGGEGQLKIIGQLARQGEAGFDALKEIAEYKDMRVRVAAVEGLGRIAIPEVRTIFEKKLHDDREIEVCRAVLRSLQRLNKEDARHVLGAGFRHSSPVVRREVIAVINARGEDMQDSELLGAALTDSDEGVFWEVLTSGVSNKLLRGVKPDARQYVFKRLRKALTNESPKIRAAAARAMSDLENEEFLPDLYEVLLKDPDVKVKWAALAGLTGIVKSVGRDLIDAVVVLTKDGSPGVRASAVRALGILVKKAPPEAAEYEVPAVLIGALKDQSSSVRLAAAETLGWFQGDDVLDALQAALGDEQLEVQLGAIKALGELRDGRATNNLLKALKDRKTRGAAAQALGRIKDGEACKELMDWLDRGDHGRKLSAIMALAMMHAREATPRLKALLNRSPNRLLRVIRSVLRTLLKLPSADVRAYAVVALGRLGDPSALPVILTPAKHEPAGLTSARAIAVSFFPPEAVARELGKVFERRMTEFNRVLRVFRYVDSKQWQTLERALTVEKIPEAVRSQLEWSIGRSMATSNSLNNIAEHRSDLFFFQNPKARR